MKLKKIMMIGFTSLLAIGFVSGCNSVKSSSNAAESKSAKVGEKEKTKSVEFGVESAEYVLPEKFHKSINGKILKVRVNLKNIGDAPLSLMERDFALYQGDEEMKGYSSGDSDLIKSGEIDKGKKVSGSIYFDVKDASSYELVYKKYRLNPDKEKEEKISIKIDGKELAKKAKDLDKPAEALSAYINAAFYDKDIEKINKLTGEDGKQYVKEVEKSFKTTSATRNDYGIDEQQFMNYFKVFKETLQKKVKFETKVVAVSSNREITEVELKGKPLMISELQTKVENEGKKLLSENPSISRLDLIKKQFEYMTSIVPEAPIASSEETVTVNMKKYGKDQWRIEDQYGNNAMIKVFAK
ncbi:DUF5105 domain-containing protein [Bacillus cereus group sp. BfR-BA-01380]|uniref:DUF5105 domain-containing protein n=1 Tax=Bacillus cereus group sp. BfR-BA-01380 TaxID=2920324 RepID=UPI001F589389|nr:DUF5105 domain-containing protein [Bacillus cereus group sp. BfR-BA-01380]